MSKTPIKPAARAPRWDPPTPDPLLVGQILGTLQAHLRADMANDAVAHFARTDPGQSPPSECLHGWIHVAGTLWRCPHCGVRRRFEQDYEP